MVQTTEALILPLELGLIVKTVHSLIERILARRSSYLDFRVHNRLSSYSAFYVTYWWRQV